MWFITSIDGDYIGEMRLKGIFNNESEIGYGINEKYQHDRYGTESVKDLNDWTLYIGKVNRIIVKVEESNIYSIELLVKAEYIKERKKENGIIFSKKME